MREEWVGLAERARAGDREAFTGLVERFKEGICAAILPVVRDWQLTQDVAQDAFAAAYLRLGELREPERFKGWLFRIARNRAVSRLRQALTARMLSVDLEEEEHILGARRASGCALTTGARGVEPEPAVLGRIRREIERLPNGYGELLVMRYVEGLSIREVALATGRSAKAVKAVLYRARILARRVLTRAGLDYERVLNEM